jgi:hypothetical protein
MLDLLSRRTSKKRTDYFGGLLNNGSGSRLSSLSLINDGGNSLGGLVLNVLGHYEVVLCW